MFMLLLSSCLISEYPIWRRKSGFDLLNPLSKLSLELLFLLSFLWAFPVSAPTFKCVFPFCIMINAPKHLVLPSTKLQHNCIVFQEMFLFFGLCVKKIQLFSLSTKTEKEN